MIIEEDVITKEIAVTAEVAADEEVAVEAAEEVTATTNVSIMMILALFMAGENGAISRGVLFTLKYFVHTTII
jgi:hypothetical protein